MEQWSLFPGLDHHWSSDPSREAVKDTMWDTQFFARAVSCVKLPLVRTATAPEPQQMKPAAVTTSGSD